MEGLIREVMAKDPFVVFIIGRAAQAAGWCYQILFLGGGEIAHLRVRSGWSDQCEGVEWVGALPRTRRMADGFLQNQMFCSSGSVGGHLPWQVRGNAENEESTLPVLAKKGDAIPESVLAKSYHADGSIAGENQQDGAAVVIEGIVVHPFISRRWS
ncbi:MAG: hypothetical protein QUV06_05840 [Cyanobium sp. CZS 48M]|nr:hypothetical protein [Cyanobium sp. CZS48M]